MSRRPRSACPRRPRGLWLRDRPSTGRRDRRGRTDCHFLPSTAWADLSPIQDSRRAPNPDGPPAALSHRPNRSLVAPWREMGSKPRHLAPMSPKGANTNRSSQPPDRSATAADALTEFLSRLVRDYRVPFSRRMKSPARRASRDVEHAGRALIEILRLPLIDREKDVVQCPEEPRATPVRLESGSWNGRKAVMPSVQPCSSARGICVDSALRAQRRFARSVTVKQASPAGGRLCGSVVAQLHASHNPAYTW